MSPRCWLGVAVTGVGLAVGGLGCDSSDDDDDDVAPAGDTNAVSVSVDGVFSGSRSNTNGAANIQFSFNQSGAVLTGSFQDSSLGSGVISGDIQGDDLEFTTVMSGGVIILEWEGQAAADGSAIEGTWTTVAGGANSGSFTVQR